MSKLMRALTALTFGLSGTTAAQVPYGSAAHTAEVGGVEIQSGGRTTSGGHGSRVMGCGGRQAGWYLPAIPNSDWGRRPVKHRGSGSCAT